MKKTALKFLLTFILVMTMVMQMIPVGALSLRGGTPSYAASATSAASGHGADAAADGDTSTYWQAEAGDKSPALTCDLGEISSVTGYKQIFLTSDVWFFTVYGSLDGETWVPIAD